MDYSEKWGKDVDEAVKLALIELKVSIDEVNVIVLEESSKGFFGLGSKLAKVRVEKKSAKEMAAPAAAEPREKPAKAEKFSDRPERNEETRPTARKDFGKKNNRPERRSGEDRPREDRARVPEKIEQERPDDLVPTDSHLALDFVKDITEKMGLSLEIKAQKNDSCIYIDIEGKDSGTVIGKRGQTLDSLQYLTSLVANKEKEKYIRVVLDAESYRGKREKTLEQLADRLAGKVVRTRKSVRLEPMNPYERKVSHAKLQSNPKVTTRSEGEEPYRRVIIEIK